MIYLSLFNIPKSNLINNFQLIVCLRAEADIKHTKMCILAYGESNAIEDLLHKISIL